MRKNKYKTLPPEADTQPELQTLNDSRIISKPKNRYSLKTGDKEYIVYAKDLKEAGERFPQGVPGAITLLTPLEDDIKNKLAVWGEDVSPINIANQLAKEREKKREEKKV
jgi:hypothetical protein